jgi:hypothetical protein
MGKVGGASRRAETFAYMTKYHNNINTLTTQFSHEIYLHHRRSLEISDFAKEHKLPDCGSKQ